MEEATVIRNATEKDVTRSEDMIAALCEFHGDMSVIPARFAVTLLDPTKGLMPFSL